MRGAEVTALVEVNQSLAGVSVVDSRDFESLVEFNLRKVQGRLREKAAGAAAEAAGGDAEAGAEEP